MQHDLRRIVLADDGVAQQGVIAVVRRVRSRYASSSGRQLEGLAIGLGERHLKSVERREGLQFDQPRRRARPSASRTSPKSTCRNVGRALAPGPRNCSGTTLRGGRAASPLIAWRISSSPARASSSISDCGKKQGVSESGNSIGTPTRPVSVSSKRPIPLLGPRRVEGAAKLRNHGSTRTCARVAPICRARRAAAGGRAPAPR